MAPPLLFVHGLGHGAWCWEEHFLPFFRSRGFQAEAVDLRGHGGRPPEGSLRFTALSSYVEDVRAAAQALPAPPVLVGHSMGGAIVQKYLSAGGPAAGAVLVASVPHTGVWGATLRYAAAHPLRFLAINGRLSFRPMVGSPEAFATFFSPSTPREHVARLQAKAQDESYRAFLDMLLMAAARPRRAPVSTLVVAGSDDSLFTPAAERRLARYHSADFELFSGLGHDLMLEPGWERVAARIERFLGGLNAA